jgi:hypothetical protein
MSSDLAVVMDLAVRRCGICGGIVLDRAVKRCRDGRARRVSVEELGPNGPIRPRAALSEEFEPHRLGSVGRQKAEYRDQLTDVTDRVDACDGFDGRLTGGCDVEDSTASDVVRKREDVGRSGVVREPDQGLLVGWPSRTVAYHRGKRVRG